LNTEETSAVLRIANGHGVRVVPFGGGTKQSWGNPGNATLRVITHRMNTVREHTWQDMTCVVEAGCRWAAMQTALKEHGQFVALDPLWPEAATIGGVAATNDSGVLRLRYGSLRDLVIGMTVVLADGTIAKTGGKVVKNVAGYDLHKLMTGAHGTLGVITEVNLRLHSIPLHTTDLTVSSSDAEPLGKLLLQVMDSHLSTHALQLRGEKDGFHLDLQLVAMPEVLTAQAVAFGAMAQTLKLTATGCDATVWGFKQELADSVADVLFKATLLPTEIWGFTTAVHALGGECVTQAVGVMLATVPIAAIARIPHLRQQLEAKSGSLTILRQPAGTGLDAWGTPPDTLPLMQKVKQRFDPNNILNTGRYLGGI
jgi:glycolate oxidase FAD binding subunit